VEPEGWIQGELLMRLGYWTRLTGDRKLRPWFQRLTVEAETALRRDMAILCLVYCDLEQLPDELFERLRQMASRPGTTGEEQAEDWDLPYLAFRAIVSSGQFQRQRAIQASLDRVEGWLATGRWNPGRFDAGAAARAIDLMNPVIHLVFGPLEGCSSAQLAGASLDADQRRLVRIVDRYDPPTCFLSLLRTGNFLEGWEFPTPLANILGDEVPASIWNAWRQQAV
jgi:hypothetical protein